MRRRPGITVLVPTSPIPSHPSTAILDACLAAVRAQLPDAQIVIAADGYHDGACSLAAYGEYVAQIERRVLAQRDRLEEIDPRLRILRSFEWLHEANLTRLALTARRDRSRPIPRA